MIIGLIGRVFDGLISLPVVPLPTWLYIQTGLPQSCLVLYFLRICHPEQQCVAQRTITRGRLFFFRHGKPVPEMPWSVVFTCNINLPQNTTNVFYMYLAFVIFLLLPPVSRRPPHDRICSTLFYKTNARNYIILSCAYDKYCLQPTSLIISSRCA